MNLDRIEGPGAPRIPSPGAAERPGPAGKVPEGTTRVAALSSGAPEKSFGEVLLESIREADRLQDSAEQAIQGLASGKRDDVAGVMTAVEKADLAYRTLMGVRNKLVDAYEELMRLRI